MSLFDAALVFNPHQIEPALLAFHSPLSTGLLLADEVGLGKTIEAGERQQQRQLIFHVEYEITEKRDRLIDQLKKRLAQRSNSKPLFTIRWSVV